MTWVMHVELCHADRCMVYLIEKPPYGHQPIATCRSKEAVIKLGGRSQQSKAPIPAAYMTQCSQHSLTSISTYQQHYLQYLFELSEVTDRQVFLKSNNTDCHSQCPGALL